MNNVLIDYPRKFQLDSKGLFEWSKSSLLKGRPDFEDPDVENRNMVLISFAISVIIANRKERKVQDKAYLIVGFKNEHYDTKKIFVDDINFVLKRPPFLIEIVTPLIKDSRRVSVRNLSKLIQKTELADTLMKGTWSCYYPTAKGQPCGICNPCKYRKLLKEELIIRISKKG